MRRLIIVLTAITLVFIAAPAMRRVTRSANPHAQASHARIPGPDVKPRVINANGMEFVFNNINATAYYKVNKKEVGTDCHNGYCEETLIIDWPITIDGQPAISFQNKILERFWQWYVSDLMITHDVKKQFKTIDDLIAQCNQCPFCKRPRRVAKIPENKNADFTESLYEIYRANLYRCSSRMVGLVMEYGEYGGGGTSDSFVEQKLVFNYDLRNDCMLTANQCFKPSLRPLIESRVKKIAIEDDGGDGDWVKVEYITDNFVIEKNCVTFFYDGYAYLDRTTAVTFSFDEINEYALPLLLDIMNEEDYYEDFANAGLNYTPDA